MIALSANVSTTWKFSIVAEMKRSILAAEKRCISFSRMQSFHSRGINYKEHYGKTNRILNYLA